MALYRTCNRCTKIIQYKEKYCSNCKDKAKSDKRNRTDEKIYNTRAWKRLRHEVLEDNNHMCWVCSQIKAKKYYTVATDVHHIQSILTNPELALDYNNCLPLCKECHQDIHRYNLDSLEAIEKYFK